jgi:predicted methyltransferase
MRQSRRAAFRIALLAAFFMAAACGPSREAVQRAEDSLYRDTALDIAVASPTRTPANVARDRYRHPAATLNFFGVDPGDSVVEIWPDGGWYSEILAPYLASGGTYVAAGSEAQLRAVRALATKDPATYGKVRFAAFPAAAGEARVPDGSADLVLTFRNVHNWLGATPPVAEEAFRQMYLMLKRGGTLGVVEHRLPEEADSARERTSGYVKVSTVRALAERAGFRLAASSEINANPLDTRDHPDGVWSLPPALRGGDADRKKYLAIGESDRMTLKFVKP